ncbi:hypothetical protein VNO78_03401 [Psophocarpus tetragonolobus]|uniref:Auxin efflux carrier component n=1 Tax=Psophocarpus tetragonolobus TaxID=3891 RepID=A0AAN9TD60_PSOTE
MINGEDIYNVVAALVPLYMALILAYGSVRWWKVFTPEQCSGINRFVSVFAVPFLSFHLISGNNPYTMNLRFLAADSLQKIVILVALILWSTFTKWGSIDWTITLFSLSTLPNTLVMGIPLLKAMYGGFTADLMVQVVVFQSVIWYTLLLIMFEYRGAKLLISEQFPNTAGAIATVRVDSSVGSLNGEDPLEAEATIGESGELHVVVRSMSRSGSVASSFPKSYSTPRPTNLIGIEIHSVGSYREQGMQSSSVKSVGFQEGVTNMEETKCLRSNSIEDGFLTSLPKATRSNSGGQRNKDISGETESLTHMLVSSPSSDVNMGHALNRVGSSASQTIGSSSVPNFPHQTSASIDEHEPEIEEVLEQSIMASQNEMSTEGSDANKKTQKPRASVILKLILIMVWKNLIRNPNTYASVIGLVWSLIFFRWNIKMPTIVKGSIEIMSNTGLGMAMFSLGLFMALQPKIITCGKAKASISMGIRFLVGPAVIIATSKIMAIHGVLIKVTIVQAALPQGIVPFVFAKEYNLHPDILSTSVIFGMVIALPVTIIYYVVLGVI